MLMKRGKSVYNYHDLVDNRMMRQLDVCMTGCTTHHNDVKDVDVDDDP